MVNDSSTRIPVNLDSIVDRIVFPIDGMGHMFGAAYFSGRLQLLRWPSGEVLQEIQSVYQVGSSRIALSAQRGVVVAAGFNSDTVAGYSITSGTVLWSLKLSRPNTIVIDRGRCFVAHGDACVTVIDVDLGSALDPYFERDVSNLICASGVDHMALRERSETIEVARTFEEEGKTLRKRAFGVVAAAQTGKLFIVSWAGGSVSAYHLQHWRVEWEQPPHSERSVLRFGHHNHQGFLPAVISIPNDGFWLSLYDVVDGSVSNVTRLPGPTGDFHPTDSIFVCGNGALIDAFSGKQLGHWREA
jgi:hypothetical protein